MNTENADQILVVEDRRLENSVKSDENNILLNILSFLDIIRQLRNKFAILIENKDRLLHCKILRMEGGGH